MKKGFWFSLIVWLLVLSACSNQVPTEPLVKEVTRVVVVTATALSPTSTVAPTSTPTLEMVSTKEMAPGFVVRSVDLMKYSQDVLRNPPNDEFMEEMIDNLIPLNLTHVAISVPYDAPADMAAGEPVTLARRWVQAIRAGGMKVWHRPSPIGFKEFYDAPFNPNLQDHLNTIRTYITNNPDLFAAGDIFTPIPEPQVNRVKGINCFDPNPCMFEGVGHLSSWLKEAGQTAEEAFAKIGLEDQVTVGRWGFDGFILWGDRNDGWEGKLHTLQNGLALIAADNGVMCIDHYFPADSDPQAEFEKIKNFHPEAKLWLCEWGPKDGQPPEYVDQVFAAALESQVEAVNWWQSGPGGKEALFELQADGSLAPTAYFEVLKRYFNPE